MLAYYGDDFTGSTDVLEALTRGGVRTILFTEPPTADLLARWPDVRAVGIAAGSRTMSPAEMDVALVPAFESLRNLQPRIVHYKVCSTFDSSPAVGSIGRAIDLGGRVFANRFVPLVVGAPVLQRFCVFGNLFARSGLDSAAYRLDRHPTMRHHPVTPMTEADLRLHLAEQTERSIALVDVLALERGHAAAAEELEHAIRNAGDGGIVLFDTLTDAHLATIGRLVWESHEREQNPLFVAGSSSVEYALVKHWHAAGLVEPATPARPPSAAAVDRVLVVSGSCSPVTARQITWATEHGFAEVPLDTPRLLAADEPLALLTPVAEQVVAELAAGRSVIVHTSRGPDDPRLAAARQLQAAGTIKTAAVLGDILGQVVRAVLQREPVRRMAVTGGDTAGSVARSLGIEALEMAAPLAPGAPLCTVRGREELVEGLEITFKGGQVGHDDFFGSLLRGGPS